ncbi:hypothetical protein HI113_14400 [Corallococcus exiguus]|uniref:DUF6086 family protein n=1 Tax=Corallococcus exiguus TaxID=83462 RepID=UPI001474F75E|nr:DUF6086 family protein [Corallococcus exiguus]NNB95087.1 hypothetical protein [Corallococcus exiguus]
MGVFFHWQEAVAWHPGQRTARFFISQVRALEEALEVQSGFGEIIADEVVLNPSLIRVFVSALVEVLDSITSNSFKTMVAGPFAIAYGILVACEPDLSLPMSDATGRLARRGEVLVSGRRRVEPIYEGLGD